MKSTDKLTKDRSKFFFDNVRIIFDSISVEKEKVLNFPSKYFGLDFLNLRQGKEKRKLRGGKYNFQAKKHYLLYIFCNNNLERDSD